MIYNDYILCTFCHSEVELISLSGLNTVRNCAVTFLCKSTSDCDKDIQYKTRNTAWIEMEESACAEDMTWKNCSHKFLENSSVNCIASIAGRQSKIQEIKVLGKFVISIVL